MPGTIIYNHICVIMHTVFVMAVNSYSRAGGTCRSQFTLHVGIPVV